jgi:hypothetical protein
MIAEAWLMFHVYYNHPGYPDGYANPQPTGAFESQAECEFRALAITAMLNDHPGAEHDRVECRRAPE